MALENKLGDMTREPDDIRFIRAKDEYVRVRVYVEGTSTSWFRVEQLAPADTSRNGDKFWAWNHELLKEIPAEAVQP